MMISTVTCSILAVMFDAPSHHFYVQKLLQWETFTVVLGVFLFL